MTSTYVESSKKSEGDGVTTFMACFNDPSTPAKCMFGKRDAFRKTTHFTPVGSTFQRYEFENHVFSYIALVECGMPIYFFVPRYSSEGGWLFIKKVAMLLDGDLALERDFSELRPDIKREILPSGRVEEEVHLVATEADQMGMHKAIEAKEISVRITGEKGYVNLKAKQISSLRDDATIMQFVYDKLGRALKEKTPATCK